MSIRADEDAVRADVFRWLEEQFMERGGYEIHHTVLKSYRYGDERIPLIDTGRGIRNPASFSATLSILTSWKSQKRRRYNDEESEDGWVSYSYRDGDVADNVKLIRAFEDQVPIVYFRPVREGYYLPYYPIVIAENDPVARRVRFPLDGGLALLGDPLDYTIEQRRYAQGIVKKRLHQPVFRAAVLRAYDSSCTVCDLKHTELLDAAHIEPDSSHDGIAHVTNGLALCKFHHAAFDRWLMGITPDFEVRVNAQVLEEMHGRRIRLPRYRNARPSRDLLAKRFELFTQRS